MVGGAEQETSSTMLRDNIHGAEVDALKNDIATLERQYRSSESKVAETMFRVNKLRGEAESREKELNLVKKHSQRLLEDKKEVEWQLSESRDYAKSLEDKLAQGVKGYGLVQKNHTMHSQIQQLVGENRAQKDLLQQQKQQLDKQKKQIHNLAIALEHKTHDGDQENDAESGDGNGRQGSRQLMEIAQLKSQCAELKLENDSKTEALKMAEGNLKSLRGTIDELNFIRDQNNAELTNLENENYTLQQKIKSLEDAVHVQQIERGEREHYIEELANGKNQLEGVVHRALGAEKTIHSLENENAQLRQELADMTEKANQITKKFAIQHAILTKEQEQLKDMKADLKMGNERILAHDQTIQELRETIANQTATVAKAKQDIAQAQEMKSSIETERQQHKEEVARVRDALQSTVKNTSVTEQEYRQKLREKIEELTRTMEERDHIRMELHEYSTAAESSSMKMKKLEKDKIQLLSQVEELTQEKATMHKNFLNAETAFRKEISDLTAENKDLELAIKKEKTKVRDLRATRDDEINKHVTLVNKLRHYQAFYEKEMAKREDEEREMLAKHERETMEPVLAVTRKAAGRPGIPEREERVPGGVTLTDIAAGLGYSP